MQTTGDSAFSSTLDSKGVHSNSKFIGSVGIVRIYSLLNFITLDDSAMKSKRTTRLSLATMVRLKEANPLERKTIFGIGVPAFSRTLDVNDLLIGGR